MVMHDSMSCICRDVASGTRQPKRNSKDGSTTKNQTGKTNKIAADTNSTMSTGHGSARRDNRISNHATDESVTTTDHCKAFTAALESGGAEGPGQAMLPSLAWCARKNAPCCEPPAA